MTLKRLAFLCLVVLMIAGSFFVVGCQPDAAPDVPDDADETEEEAVDVTVVVGSKEFTESLILSQLAILALEDNGFTVVDETGLGGTVIAQGSS
jgi:osmoprotectant transport system substrate-binding protein